jgi:hypothetical protein
MVLQRERENRVWGRAKPGEQVTVKIADKLPHVGQAVIVDIGEGKDITRPGLRQRRSLSKSAL